MAKNVFSGPSNPKKYKEYLKKPRREGAFWEIITPIREYAIFIIPLVVVYLLYYFAIFERKTLEEGTRTAYIIVATAILVVDVAVYFLRRLYREYRFNKYSNSTVPLFRRNEWRCPNCHNINHLLAPCERCGIYPTLEKCDNVLGSESKSGSLRSRKVQKQYDEYQSQFSLDDK